MNQLQLTLPESINKNHTPRLITIFFRIPNSVYLLIVHSRCRRSLLHLITIKNTHATLDRVPLDEGSACLRKLYVATHNTNSRQTFMPSA